MCGESEARFCSRPTSRELKHRNTTEANASDWRTVYFDAKTTVFGSTACGGSREVGVLLAQAACSRRRQWRSLGARSMLDARSFMISTLRSQVGFAAAVAHARLRLSRLELIGGSGRTAGRYASAARSRPSISPRTAFEQARGGALGAGGGRVGFAGGDLF